MQEGIHILNKTEIMEMPGWVGVTLFIGIILAVISFTCLILAENSILIISSGVTMFIGVLMIIFSPIVGNEVETGRYRYEVTIDESVKFSDIYDNYEVIEQRGEIWVLEDLEE